MREAMKCPRKKCQSENVTQVSESNEEGRAGYLCDDCNIFFVAEGMTITEAIEREQRNTLRLIEILNRLDELNKGGRVPKAKIAELVGKVEGIVRTGEAIDRGIAGAIAEAENE